MFDEYERIKLDDYGHYAEIMETEKGEWEIWIGQEGNSIKMMALGNDNYNTVRSYLNMIVLEEYIELYKERFEDGE